MCIVLIGIRLILVIDMNERIKELAVEAGMIIGDASNFDMAKFMPKEVKFAELIVRECMNAVCDPSTTHLESMTDASAMYTARERIRKRFRS